MAVPSYWQRQIFRQVQEAGFDSACAVGNSLSHAKDRILALPAADGYGSHRSAGLGGLASWVRAGGYIPELPGVSPRLAPVPPSQSHAILNADRRRGGL